MSRLTVSIVLAWLAPSALVGFATVQVEPLGIYVTPYYNADGPIVEVGEFSAGLAAADLETVRATVQTMHAELGTLRVEAMYVAALRLHDLGDRDAAVDWFYRAQFRARLFGTLLDPDQVGTMGSPPFELTSAYNAFYQLSGPAINGYAGCSQTTWMGAIATVLAENETVVDVAAIYPTMPFLPRDRWQAGHREIADGLMALSDHLRDHWDEIRAGREANDADRRFCVSLP